MLALRFEMRGHHARAGLLADLDRFPDGIEQRRRGRTVLARDVPERIAAFAALVRDVDAVHRRQLARELDHFVGRAPAAGLVLETRGHPNRAFL